MVLFYNWYLLEVKTIPAIPTQQGIGTSFRGSLQNFLCRHPHPSYVGVPPVSKVMGGSWG